MFVCCCCYCCVSNSASLFVCVCVFFFYHHHHHHQQLMMMTTWGAPGKPSHHIISTICAFQLVWHIIMLTRIAQRAAQRTLHAVEIYACKRLSSHGYVLGRWPPLPFSSQLDCDSDGYGPCHAYWGKQANSHPWPDPCGLTSLKACLRHALV